MRVPRNVITLVPRRLVLPTRKNAERKERIVASLHQRFRPQQSHHGGRVTWEIRFPNSFGKRTAREHVVEVLADADPRWRTLFILYPKESAL